MKRSNKIVLAALAVLATAAPLSAFAAPPKAHAQHKFEEYTTGTIASVNAQEIKLAGGDTFKLAPGVQTASFKAGDKVNVRFTKKDGARTADQIKAALN